MRGIFRAVIIILVSLILAEVVFFNVNNDQVLSVLITEEIISKSTSTLESTSILQSTSLRLAPDDGPMKTILVWNAYDRVEVKDFGYGHKPFAEKCPVKNCTMTADHHFVPMGQFDAILFNVPLLFNISQKLPEKSERQPHQRYIFLSQESPVYNVEQLGFHEGVFNWTMSYQTFSDIPLIYGRYAPRTEADPPVSNWNTSSKTKLIAWFASHCGTQSKRELYVYTLLRYVDVGIYGSCGPLKCDLNIAAGISTSGCYDLLERDYKFYLSFENSICVDYVTEKFFAILDYNVVPVVLGGANYSKFAPPNSYIDALQYTPRQLADYLKLLDSNQTLYEQYFEWKKHYVVHRGLWKMTKDAFCHLCEKLHNDSEQKVYSNLQETWSAEAQCSEPTFQHDLPSTLFNVPNLLFQMLSYWNSVKWGNS